MAVVILLRDFSPLRCSGENKSSKLMFSLFFFLESRMGLAFIIQNTTASSSLLTKRKMNFLRIYLFLVLR